ncbi:MAG TPA: phosphopantetheine-binding protein [Acidimicrobiales bacterium]|nr:phosphopantetheine-binding protein [Acidimicrobiales bacterium]
MDDVKAFEMFRQCAVDVLQVEADLVRLEASFAEDLDADSLDLLELALAVEESFGIRVVEEELRDVKTVEQAFTLVLAKL